MAMYALVEEMIDPLNESDDGEISHFELARDIS